MSSEQYFNVIHDENKLVCLSPGNVSLGGGGGGDNIKGLTFGRSDLIRGELLYLKN